MVKGSSSRNVSMGVVMGWMIGVASIALLGLIMLILFGNLSGNVGFGTQGTTIQVNNETPSWVNSSNYTFAVTNSSTSNYAIINMWNVSADLVPSGFYQVDGDVIFSNGTNYLGAGITNTTYTYVYTTDTIGKQNTDNFINNYTKSVSNTSEQFPVVGTIIGIGLLLLILISLLVFALVQLGKMSGAGSGGNFG